MDEKGFYFRYVKLEKLSLIERNTIACVLMHANIIKVVAPSDYGINKTRSEQLKGHIFTVDNTNIAVDEFLDLNNSTLIKQKQIQDSMKVCIVYILVVFLEFDFIFCLFEF
jgi:hypothetical protein